MMTCEVFRRIGRAEGHHDVTSSTPRRDSADHAPDQRKRGGNRVLTELVAKHEDSAQEPSWRETDRGLPAARVDFFDT
jgi:hypothetical protein